MSDMSNMSKVATTFQDAASVPVWTRPSGAAFTSKPGNAPHFSPWAEAEGNTDQGFQTGSASNDVDDVEALIAQGYADGLSEGHRLATIELDEERAALARLAEGLACLNPEDADGLAAMLANAVKRLVTQIVGEVEINPDTLAERTRAVAAMIAEETAPTRLRLHPTDIARLTDARIAVEMIGDPLLAPGTIVLDTGSGWVEDGPHIRLERLRSQLDRLGAPK